MSYRSLLQSFAVILILIFKIERVTYDNQAYEDDTVLQLYYKFHPVLH